MVWIEEYAHEKNEGHVYLLDTHEQNDCRSQWVWDEH